MTAVEIDPMGKSDDVRHNDEELMALRLRSVREDVIPFALARGEGLNDWQTESLQAIASDIRPDQTVDLPTRSGKSHLIRHIAESAQRVGVRTAIVSHRKHILDEHADKLGQRSVAVVRPGYENLKETAANVFLVSAQSIAANSSKLDGLDDGIDLVLVDEAHKSLGEKTVKGMRSIFPNAVRIAVTATPEYAEDRSVMQEYGDRIISRSIVEAIEEGKVSPLHAFLYKTEANIDVLDPQFADFTPRELHRLAEMSARNQAIVDTVQDLVNDGRQGLVTTIPGENLLHADILKKMLQTRNVRLPDGTSRKIRALVVRGNDANLNDKLEEFEFGEVDVLLYCDLLREGYSTDVASFLVNGRPTTSIVNYTQDVGRVLQPKEKDAIVVDFLDESVKRQRTVYDVVELDRCVQGIFVGPKKEHKPDDAHSGTDTYLRGLFRPDLEGAFRRINNRLLSELHYQPKQKLTPLEVMRLRYEQERAAEFARQSKTWERLLAKAGLLPEVGPDMLGASFQNLSRSKYASLNDDGTYTIDPTWQSLEDTRAYPLIEYKKLVVPTVAVDPYELAASYIGPRHSGESNAVEDILINPTRLLRPFIIETINERLDEREKTVLVMRFGLDGKGMRSLDEIARSLPEKISKEHVRQIEAKALSQLRTYNTSTYWGLLGLLTDIDEPYQRQRIIPSNAVVVSEPPATPESAVTTDLDMETVRQKNRQAMRERNSFYKNVSQLIEGEKGWSHSRSVEVAANIIIRVAGRLGFTGLDFGRYHKVLQSIVNEIGPEEMGRLLRQAAGGDLPEYKIQSFVNLARNSGILD